MPDDNPYAAPQTIGIAPALPLADAVEPIYRRKFFPQLDTLELRRLVDFSNALCYMRFLWLIVLASCVGVAIALFIRQDHPAVGYLLLILSPLVVCRIYTDERRSERARHFSQTIDLFACLASLAGGLTGGSILVWRGAEGIALCMVLFGSLFLLGMFPLSSYLAHYCADELFGPRGFRHRELAQEMQYRTKYKVP